MLSSEVFLFHSTENDQKYSIDIYDNNTFAVNYAVFNNDSERADHYRWGRCQFHKIKELDLKYLGFPQDLMNEIEKRTRRYVLLKVFK